MEKNCQQCNGEGNHYSNLTDHSGRHNGKVSNIVPCLNPTCENGKVSERLVKEYYKFWK